MSCLDGGCFRHHSNNHGIVHSSSGSSRQKNGGPFFCMHTRGTCTTRPVKSPFASWPSGTHRHWKISSLCTQVQHLPRLRVRGCQWVHVLDRQRERMKGSGRTQWRCIHEDLHQAWSGVLVRQMGRGRFLLDKVGLQGKDSSD